MKKEEKKYFRRIILSKKSVSKFWEKLRTSSTTIVKFRETLREDRDSLVNAMGGGDHPFGIDQHTAAPVTDEAQFWMQQLKGHLPGPGALPAGFAVEDAAGGRSSGGGGDRRRGRDVVL